MVKAWSLVRPNGTLVNNGVRRKRTDAIGYLFDPSVWKQAYREGWRCVPVDVIPHGSTIRVTREHS